MAILQPKPTKTEEKPSRNVLATKLTLGPPDKLDRKRFGELVGIKKDPEALAPLAFLAGWGFLNAFTGKTSSE